MTEKFKIRITIANRVYPINVQSEEEEESLRKAAVKINNLIQKFEQDYAVTDKQDVLAMCALQFASSLEIDRIKEDAHIEKAAQRLQRINRLLSERIDETTGSL